MLNRLSFLVLGLLVSAGFHNPAHAATITRDLSFAPGQYAVQEINGWAMVELRGATHALPAGHPDLPQLPILVELPDATEIASVRVEVLESASMGRFAKLLTMGVEQADGQSQSAPLDPTIAAMTSAYPPSMVATYGSGRMRGRTLGNVAVSPFQWNPATGEITLATRLRVIVETKPAPLDPGDLVMQRESRDGDRTFNPAIAQLTGEPLTAVRARSQLTPKVNSGAPFNPTFRPTVDGSAVDMVIITTEDQEAAYQELADFRTKLGTATVVRTVTWIKANYPLGVDTGETIRNFMRDAVSKWGTAWVLLGADTDFIPVRYGFTNFFGSEEIPTDLYYTDLDRTWNADGDAVFGEGNGGAGNPGDNLDLYPDVWVGRLPSNNLAEAQLFVDKVIDYTASPPLGYQNDLLFLSEVLFPQEWTTGQVIQFDGAILSEDVEQLYTKPNHNMVRMYENYTGWPGSIPETKAAVVDSINSGFNLVHHVGHGYINTMSVGINHATLVNADADAFTNGNETFLLYAINCTSAAVDFNCIAERFLTNPNGGALGVIGSTRLDFPSTGRVYQNEFYDLLFLQEMTALGQAFAMAKAPFVPFASQDNTHRWTQFTHIFLGDPSLEFWTDVPDPLVVTHNPTFNLGGGTFSVNVTRNAAAEESARVTLYKDGDAYSVGLTDASGNAVLAFRPDVTGAFTVGVSAHNAIPYIGNASVVAAGATPYLFALSQSFVDDGSGSTVGNGNGKLDTGETVELRVTLKNNGTATETLVSAGLSTADPYLTILDNSSGYNNLAAGASAAPNDPFLIAVNRSAPDRWEARCTLTITGFTNVYVQEIVLYVHGPVFEYRIQSVRDSVGNGNNNNVITAGEDFVILPTLRNIGLGPAQSVQARLRSTDPAVTITDSVSVLGTLAPGGIVTPAGDGFRLQLSDVLSPHVLTVVLVDAYGEVFSKNVDWIRPGTVSNLTAFGGDDNIAIKITKVSTADVAGYNIYRATSSGGPYSRVNLWTTVRSAYFVDEGLPALTRYYYKAAAVDSSGNEGEKSIFTSATTTLPLHTGFPIEIGTASTAGVTLADLDNNPSQLEILGAGEEIYAVTADGEDFYDGDNDVRTLGPLSSTGKALFWNTPAVGDVDNDGDVEVAAVGWNDEFLHLIDTQGNELPGFPKDVNPFGAGSLNPLGSVCMADLDADGDLEIFTTQANLILAWHHDGTEFIDGDSNPGTDGVWAITGSTYSYGTPTVANIDDDIYPELICGMRDGFLYVFNHDGTTYPGFPFNAGANITSSPAVGDIDGDGIKEIVFGSSNSQCHALRPNLTQATGFPVGIQLNEDIDSSPALGDMNGDGRLDVVIGASNGALFAFNGTNGFVMPGFPLSIKDNQGVKIPVRSSPVLADVNNDGSLDIVFGDQIGRVHGVDYLGAPLPGFPIQTGNLVENSPAVWDVDGDGLVEVVAESFDQKLYCWDTPWAFNPAKAVWPMFKRDQRNSGNGAGDVLNQVSAPDPERGLTPLLLQNYPNPFHASTMIRYQVPEGSTYQPVNLRIFDLSGRVVRTLIAGEQPPGTYEMNWNGEDESGRSVAAGIYHYRLETADQTLSRRLVLLGR